MTQRNPIAPRQGVEARVAALHKQAREDYIKGQQQRSMPSLAPSYASIALAASGPTPEPTDLDVAIGVAQLLLDSDNAHALRESLRVLLRALGAEPASASAPPEPHTPIGPGCGAPATVRYEGYSPRNGLAHGSLDLTVYACEEHDSQARTEWLDGLLAYRTLTVGTSRCGERFDFTTLGGGQ